MNSRHKLAVLYIKNVGRFIEIVIRIHDGEGTNRKISMSNKRSSITVEKSNVTLPIDIGQGWQYMCIDLSDITKRCFGTNFNYCYEVQVKGPTRVAKIYFQSKPFSDAELPDFLRVI